MPHLVMPPFNFGKAQAHFEFAFEFDTHKSEEQSENKHIKVDLMVALELQPIKLEVNFDTTIVFGVVDNFNGIEGFALIQTFAL
jgi:hypothetical protein